MYLRNQNLKDKNSPDSCNNKKLQPENLRNPTWRDAEGGAHSLRVLILIIDRQSFYHKVMEELMVMCYSKKKPSVEVHAILLRANLGALVITFRL